MLEQLLRLMTLLLQRKGGPIRTIEVVAAILALTSGLALVVLAVAVALAMGR